MMASTKPRKPHAVPQPPTTTARRVVAKKEPPTSVVDFDSPHVSLQGIEMDAKLCAEMCSVLLTNDRVTSLDLSHNRLGDDGLESLSSLVSANPNIVKLNVSHNFIGDWGVVCLSRALNRHGTMQSLNLSNNRFGDSGLSELGRFLQDSKHITELILTDTPVTLRGALSLAEVLVQNDSLLYVSLPYSLGFQVIDEVNRILRRNWIRMNNLDEQVALGRTLNQKLQHQNDMRAEQWKIEQSVAEKKKARTRTVEAPLDDWADPTIASTMMFLSLLDKKAKIAEKEVAEQKKANAKPGHNTPRYSASQFLSMKASRETERSSYSLPPIPGGSARSSQRGSAVSSLHV